jgi:zinc-binding alcohol dehydrogenase family protein
MKAIGYKRALPIEDPDALLDVILPEPTPGPHDLLVDVKAVSVNPADTKVRRSTNPPPGQTKVLGWDAAGVVRAIGANVKRFKPGDKVFYAGSIARAGTYAERHAVDERIVGKMPASLNFAQAAALPLTTITAWELLFDRLQVVRNPLAVGNQLLVIGAPGGVGSILLQLARKLTDLTIIGTASNTDSEAWIRERGAHHVIDHRKPLVGELRRIGIPSVAYVAGLTHTERHFPQIAEALAPEGRLAIIDDPTTPLDIMLLKPKSISLHWEYMFTRSLFHTVDMIEQHILLDRVSELVDQGVIKTTLAHNYGTITAENLRRAHALIESGRARGKIVLEGF